MSQSLDQANTNAGLPTLSSLSGNIQPPSTSDLGGSLGDKATSLSTGPTNAFQTYSDYAKSLPTAMGTYNALEQQNGIPQLKSTSQSLQNGVNDLETQIAAVPKNITSNTPNSLVTESQRAGMQSAEELPLQQVLTPQAQALGAVNSEIGTAEQGIGNEVNAQNTDNSNMLTAQGMGVTVASDNAAREMTGFSTDESNVLTGLMHKMDNLGTLDQADLQQLSTLSEKKMEFDNALQQIKAKAATTAQPVGAYGAVTFDPNTGAPIPIGAGNNQGIGGSSGRYSKVP